jgi:hypothetical protein
MLSQLLDHVPHFCEYLPSSSLSALSGTSPALRQKVHDYVTKISGSMNDQDIAILVRGLPDSFPQLRSLHLTIRGPAATFNFAHARLPLWENLNLSENELAGPAIGYLSQGRWPKLNLASNMIANDGVSHLRTAEWPSLSNIDLSNNRFEGSAIRLLHCCKWPALQMLCLSRNNLGYGWGELPVSTEWPRLRKLVINSCQLSLQAATALSKPMWSYLETLDLCGNNLYDSAMRELVQAPWALLKALSLSGNRLQNQGITFLITGEWPLMAQMCLKNMDMDEFTLGQLNKAKSPLLKRLEIGQSRAPFALENISHLISAQWPLLEHLSLHSNNVIATDVVTQLSKGEWPLLKHLQAGLPSLDALCLLPVAFHLLQEIVRQFDGALLLASTLAVCMDVCRSLQGWKSELPHSWF